MLEYVLKRVGMAFLTVLIIACITFLMMNAIPGSPFLNERSQPPEVLAALEAKYGLDKPLYQQLWNYLTSFVQGDMGVSLKMQKNRDVAEIIFEKFPVSVKVGGWAILNAIVCGIPLGCLAAYNRGKWVDSVLRIITTAGVAIPSFVVCTVLLIVFGVKLSILPTMGLDSWQNYLMPCFALSFYPMCYIARLMRSSMLDVINQDYIRTARAKGVAPVMLIFKHALRNSLIPVITYLGPMVAYTVTGGFVVETVFSIPGLGRYFIQSILARDYPIIMGTTIFLSILIIVMNLLVDIAYKIVDPRISFTKGGE
ncbi:MAG TPA: ABC transporter permease [Oscillospiraceae bacterium]|nr:ABC transporter permease [Oscillospiraceae bacterium]HQQ89142.1 ABC transporter permease [Oscillospiraceae bacterium]HRW56151.1 ABC transporter permease [Oscillospiraceae bacterium]